MSETKIALSDKELEMVNDREWILTKQAIIEKIYHLLESVIKDIDELILPTWEALAQMPTSPPRIFKGENYLGLPYVTLDYPKLFDAKNTLTVRTMFWWGNFLSVTLHAGKNYNDRLHTKLKNEDMSGSGLYVSVHENQWHHHFEPDNYRLQADLSFKDLTEIRSRDFLKVAFKIDLPHFNEAYPLLKERYRMIAGIMS